MTGPSSTSIKDSADRFVVHFAGGISRRYPRMSQEELTKRHRAAEEKLRRKCSRFVPRITAAFDLASKPHRNIIGNHASKPRYEYRFCLHSSDKPAFDTRLGLHKVDLEVFFTETVTVDELNEIQNSLEEALMSSSSGDGDTTKFLIETTGENTDSDEFHLLPGSEDHDTLEDDMITGEVESSHGSEELFEH